MDNLLHKRFWSLVRASIQNSGATRIVSFSQDQIRLSFEDGRLLIIALNDTLTEPRSLENWIKVLLNETNSKDIDVIIASSSLDPLALEQGHYEAPWPTKLAVSIINEKGDFHEITKGRTDDFIKSILQSALSVNLSDASVEQMQNEVRSLIREERERVGQILRFQSRLRSTNSMATNVMLGIIGLFYLMQIWVGGPDYTPGLVRMGANSKLLVADGEYWRLITSMFLHGSLLHLLVNSYVLYALGTFFNKLIGDARFVAIFLISGIFGSLGSALIGGTMLSVGASGALWGLFGLGGALTVWPSHFLPDTIRQSLKRVMLINLGLNFAISFLPMVDIWAHLSGGVAGFAMGFFFIFQERLKYKLRLNNTIAAIAAIIATVSIGTGFYSQQPWKLNEPMSFTNTVLEKQNLSVDIPNLTSTRRKEKNGEVFGNMFDPLTVAVAKIEEGDLPDDLNSQFMLLSQEVRTAILSLESTSVTLEESQIDGFATVFAAFVDKNGYKRWIWAQIRDNAFIHVTIKAFPNSPPHLIKNLDKIIKSIRMLSRA